MGMTRANTLPFLAALLVPLFAAACNNTRGSGGPLVKSLAGQSVGGGQTFSLDLGKYVVDDTQTASYSVLSGGGSFTGSVYSRAFPTLGTYTVSFEVRDFRNNKARGSFTVQVTSAVLAVVRNGSGVSLYDLQTQNLVSPIQNDGRTKTFKGSLENGAMIFEVSQSGQTDLWLHDPNVAGTDVFAGDSVLNERFIGITSKNQIVYERGASPSRTIWIYDPLGKSATSISAVVAGGGPRDEYGAKVAGNRVYFSSTLISNGQADVWSWDLTTSVAKAVSLHAEPETLVATLKNGGLIWTRNGANSEKDLLYWNGSAVRELGTDLSTAVNLESKTYRAATSDSFVIFETTASGGDKDLYVWNPTGPSTAAIGTSGVDERFVALSGTGRILYSIQSGSSNKDLSWFKASDSTSGSIASTGDDETYAATLSNGNVIYTRAATGKDLYHWVEATTTGTAFPGATSSGTDYVFKKVLGNDNVIYTVGADLFIFTPSTATSVSVTTTTGSEDFAAVGKDAGDFVIKVVNGSTTSLYLWDASATTSIAASTTGVASFEAMQTSDLLLFSRIAAGSTQSDLFSFKPSTTTTTQVTSGTSNDTVEAVVTAEIK